MECSFIMKHSFEEKLNYVRLALDGTPQRQICKTYGLGHNNLRFWIDRYRLYGEEGLKSKPYVDISANKKERLIRLYEEKGVPLRQICIEHNISRAAFEKWIKQVHTRGDGLLYKKQQQDHPPKDSMARPKKKEPQTELEKLQYENLRLRAENALLKKVKALVEEEEARARRNGRKPSTN